MNIVMDAFSNRIWAYKPGNKKEPAVQIFEEARFPLTNPSSCMHALSEFLTSDTMKMLVKEKSNSLVIPDFPVAFGTFTLPTLSRFKIRDVFETRFKLCYPNFESYYMTFEEYHRGEEESLFFYSLAKKSDVEAIVSFFEKNGVPIGSVDHFSHFLASNLEKKANYPSYYLLMGAGFSQIFLCKGSKLLSVMASNFGEETVLCKDQYLDSAYFFGNKRAIKYAAFIKDNFMTRKAISDDGIDACKTTTIDHQKPRALRMLKGQALEAYLLKNNIRKYASYLNDRAEYFAHDPWFIPISACKVFCTDNFYTEFTTKNEGFSSIEFERVPHSMEEIVTLPIAANPLFKKSIKKERRSIDWSKFFSMSIGPKKKA